MKISLFSLWRDSEKYIDAALKRLNSLEEYYPEITFSFFFYENDSRDDTANILSKWMINRDGKLLSENVNMDKEGSVFTSSRMQKMCYYRNRMINLGRFINTDYSIIFDSDVIYTVDIIEKFLSKVDDDTVMYTPFISQNIKCKICNCGRDSYYDSAPLFDIRGQPGLCWSCNPFTNVFDRNLLDLNKPVEIKSGFGGFAFFKSEPLNFCNWTFDQYCDHVSFCNDIRKFGKIKIYPDIRVRVELEQELLDKYA